MTDSRGEMAPLTESLYAFFIECRLSRFDEAQALRLTVAFLTEMMRKAQGAAEVTPDAK